MKAMRSINALLAKNPKHVLSSVQAENTLSTNALKLSYIEIEASGGIE